MQRPPSALNLGNDNGQLRPNLHPASRLSECYFPSLLPSSNGALHVPNLTWKGMSVLQTGLLDCMIAIEIMACPALIGRRSLAKAVNMGRPQKSTCVLPEASRLASYKKSFQTHCFPRHIKHERVS